MSQFTISSKLRSSVILNCLVSEIGAPSASRPTEYPPTSVCEPPLICDAPAANARRRQSSPSRVLMMIPVYGAAIRRAATIRTNVSSPIP
jgi:hypothetical protein